MSKCFITKLPSSVDNNTLPVLGQLKIKWLKQDSLKNKCLRNIQLQTNDSITVKVSGAHFTDNTLASNIGNVKTITAANGVVSLYVSNDADAVLTIDNKYSLTALAFTSVNNYRENIPAYFDIENIKYCTNLQNLVLDYTQISGDISALRNLTNLTNLSVGYTQVSGYISALSNMVNLTSLSLPNTQVSGDISALSDMVNLTNLNIHDTQVSGDISALSNMVNLISLHLANTQVGGYISALSNMVNLTKLYLTNTQVSGDISAVSNLTKLVDLSGLKTLSLTGDMSKIPINTVFISQADRKITTNFTWTANGRQNAKLLAMEGPVPFDTTSMDNMLIDQATCTLTPDTWAKIISVSGTRTSASDAAVTTIQNMGVTITGVTKVS